jgi:hypothetical protein
MADDPWFDWTPQFVLAQRIRDLREKVNEARADSVGDLRSILSAIDQLEVDIGRVLLRVHALADVLIEKGLISAEEMSAKAREIDGLDGEMDGTLHPSLFRTPEERDRAYSPRAFLAALEKETTSPKAFLRELEARDGQ